MCRHYSSDIMVVSKNDQYVFSSSHCEFFDVGLLLPKIGTSIEKDMIRINYTVNKILRVNMRTGISNMEDILEMMLQSGTCMFRAPMTTLLIQISSFFKCVKRLKVDAF